MNQLDNCFKKWKKETSRDISKKYTTKKIVYCDNYLVPFEESKYIVLSSCLFFIPTIYAFVKQKYIISGSGFIVTIVSVNYWRECKKSIRRDCDLIVSRVMCGVGCWNFLTNIQNNYDYIVFILLFIISYNSYNKAQFKSINWIRYHMLFHCTLAFFGFLTLNKMEDT